MEIINFINKFYLWYDIYVVRVFGVMGVSVKDFSLKANAHGG